MKRFLHIAALMLTALLLLPLGACAGEERGDALYIFNTKGENAAAMQAACDAFTGETGIPVRLFSLGSGTDSLEVLRAEMNAAQKPAIFCVMSPAELGEWVESGYARPLDQAITPEFRTLAGEVPAAFALSDGSRSYGIPFNVEGYGYLADRQMLADVFGDAQAAQQAIRLADWAEWEALVEALTAYIRRGESVSVTVGGQTLTPDPEKPGRAALLEGVFATAGSQTWTYGDHLVNVALNAVFTDPADALNADESRIRGLDGVLRAYARALDLKTANAVTPRGPEFISAITGGYDASVEALASGRALFLKQGNWTQTNFAATSDPSVAQRLSLLPVKLPLTDADVTAPGRTVQQLERSIPVYVPNYYVINARVSPQLQQWAERFLVWLNTDEDGQRFVTQEMHFIPYNAQPAPQDGDPSLSAQIAGYIARGDVLSNPYAGAPSGWSSDRLGQYVMENYLTRESWDGQVYDDIARFGVESWLAMRG